MRKNSSLLFILLIGLVIAAFIADLFTGNAPISLQEAWRHLSAHRATRSWTRSSVTIASRRR